MKSVIAVHRIFSLRAAAASGGAERAPRQTEGKGAGEPGARAHAKAGYDDIDAHARERRPARRARTPQAAAQPPRASGRATAAARAPLARPAHVRPLAARAQRAAWHART
jgi:hypothetical protein